jgi:hypothetical protein
MADPELPDSQLAVDDEQTGLRALPSWPAVYAFVIGTLIAWVALLTWLSRAFL